MKRRVLAQESGVSSTSAKAEARLVIARHLLEDAKSLGIDISRFEKTLSQLEKMRPENLESSVTSVMSDISKAVEEFKHVEDKEVVLMTAKAESQLAELRSLLEEARSLGVGISRFEAGLSKLEKSLDEPRPEMAEHVTRLTKGLRIRSSLSLFRFRTSSSVFCRRFLLFCVTCKALPAP